MVVSKLSKNINYVEKMRLDSEDIDHNATSYNVTIKDFELLIAIGKEKYTFVSKNVIYFPIYLIKDDKVFNQIGVYEIYSHKLPNILDEDGDVDLDELGDPLLYSFVDSEYLKKFKGNFDSDDESSDSDDDNEEKEEENTKSQDDKEDKEDEEKEEKESKITDRFLINKKALGKEEEEKEDISSDTEDEPEIKE